MAPRCKEYLWSDKPDTEVFEIREELYDREYWGKSSYEFVCYMESGYQFHKLLLRNGGIRIHSSAIAWNGKAFLFSGPCGIGKSTHRSMWQQLYGENAAVVFNDDKPSLRFIDGKWYAYGTPWCGRGGINKNMKVPVAGICFLEQAPENRIRRLTAAELLPRIAEQTMLHLDTTEDMANLMSNLDRLITNIPIYLLECTPTTDAAKLSSETMLQGAIDAGL